MKYKLLNSDDYITIDFQKNQIQLKNKFSKIQKKENNRIYISDTNSDFSASVLFFNKSALIWEQDKPVLTHHYDLSSSAVYKIPKFKILFFKVPENACSTVVSECYNRFYKKWYEPKCSTSQWIFKDVFPKINYRSEFEIIKQEYALTSDEYKNWKKFLVYDDPVKRFVRLLNHKYLQPKITLASMVTPQTDIQRYIDEMILLAQADNMNSRYHDTHLTSISNIWGDYLDEIDVFVNLKDLDNFMQDEFKFHPKRFLETKGHKPISQSDLTQEQSNMIKSIFEKDYEIPNNYKNKFYTR